MTYEQNQLLRELFSHLKTLEHQIDHLIQSFFPPPEDPPLEPLPEPHAAPPAEEKKPSTNLKQ